jgi:hypothetical protein
MLLTNECGRSVLANGTIPGVIAPLQDCERFAEAAVSPSCLPFNRAAVWIAPTPQGSLRGHQEPRVCHTSSGADPSRIKWC